MSRIKADLSRLSVNQLSELTGKDRRTLKKLLADIDPQEESGTLFYIPREALPVIYGISHAGLSALGSAAEDSEDDGDGSMQDRLDPIREKALLDRVRRQKIELEIAEERKKLIRIEKVEETWSKMAAAFRAKILALPKKCAPRVCATKETRQIEKILTQECHEALKELSEYGAEFERGEAIQEGS